MIAGGMLDTLMKLFTSTESYSIINDHCTGGCIYYFYNSGLQNTREEYMHNILKPKLHLILVAACFLCSHMLFLDPCEISSPPILSCL